MNGRTRMLSQGLLRNNIWQEKNNKGLTDYKFYCFNGVPLYLYVSIGLENHATAQMSFLNIDWSFAVSGRTDYKPLEKLPPKSGQDLKKVEW